MEERRLMILFFLMLNVFHSQPRQVKNKEFDEVITHNGKVYTFYYQKTEEYLNANNICMLKGGKLASIQDQQLQNKLQLAIQQQKSSCKDGVPFEKLIWIGADRSRNHKSWKWLRDGTVMNYTNWYSAEEGVGVSSDNCVALAVLNQTNGGEILAKWFRRDCNEKYSFICENDYGSGYLEQKLNGAAMENIFRICVGFGDENFRVVWKRTQSMKPKCDAREVSTLSNQSIYQQTERDTCISTTTIRTNNIRKAEFAVYKCDIENKLTGKINQIGSITMGDYINKPTKYPASKTSLRLIDSLSLVCESSGYPTPRISWTFGDKRVDPLAQADALKIHNSNNDRVLNVVSKLSILKPVILGPNATVVCTAHGRTRNRSAKFVLNSDLADVRDGGFVVNVTSYSRQTAEEECGRVGGNLINDSSERGYHCKIQVAEMRLDQSDCPGKILRIQITDFAQSDLVKMNLLLSRDTLMLKQKIVSNRTHDNQYEASYNHLNPGTSYQVNLRYRPYYRAKTWVNLTKTFTARTISPGKVGIFEAYRIEEICRVCLDYPENHSARESSKVLIKVKEEDENGTKIEDMRFATWDEISFVMENPAALFSVRLESCAGEVGEETKFMPCLPDPHHQTSSSSVIIIAIVTSVIVAVILIIGLLVCGTRKKKKSERGVDTDFPLNLTTIAVDEDIRAHTDNSPYLTPNRHIPIHSSFSQPSEM